MVPVSSSFRYVTHLTSLLTTHYSLPTFTTHYSLLTAYDSLLTPLLTTHYLQASYWQDGGNFRRTELFSMALARQLERQQRATASPPVVVSQLSAPKTPAARPSLAWLSNVLRWKGVSYIISSK